MLENDKEKTGFCIYTALGVLESKKVCSEYWNHLHVAHILHCPRCYDDKSVSTIGFITVQGRNEGHQSKSIRPKLVVKFKFICNAISSSDLGHRLVSNFPTNNAALAAETRDKLVYDQSLYVSHHSPESK